MYAVLGNPEHEIVFVLDIYCCAGHAKLEYTKAMSKSSAMNGRVDKLSARIVLRGP